MIVSRGNIFGQIPEFLNINPNYYKKIALGFYRKNIQKRQEQVKKR
jgi:hypothetical protein